MRRFAIVVVCGGCSLLTSLDDLRDGGKDAAIDVVEEPIPPPTPSCDPNEQPAANAIFVSTAGDDALAGGAATPFKTIAKAMTIAKSLGTADVYLDEGTYTEEISIASATTIHGGWKATGANWARDCQSGFVGLTVVRSPTARAVTASTFTGSAGIETLTLVTKAQADPGQSGIAVFVSGAIIFRMTGVDVTAPAGGDGLPVGAPPQAGNVACTGADVSDGVAGSASTAQGTPAGVGSFNATGYVAAKGTSGGMGTAGHNGTPGGAGQSNSSCVQGCFNNAPCNTFTATVTGGAGKCGCGGLGGTGGVAGNGGGASIGVYVFGSLFSIDHATVRSVKGGGGGAGGGGAGGGGTAGSAGTDGQCGGACTVNGSNQCVQSTFPVPGGGAGGKGGAGGSGAQGGGGAGGPSYGIVTAGGAQPTIDPTTALQSGAGGSGQGGAPDGASSKTFSAP